MKIIAFKNREERHDWEISSKWRNAKEWCKDHKEQIVVFGPTIIAGAIEIAKISSKRKNVSDEERLKDMYIYDRSQGFYYELRRKLKSSEKIEIDRRKANGEHLGQILQQMRVLK